MRRLYAPFLFPAVAASAMAIETPAYTVLTRDGAFEVRDYPALTVVRTESGDGDFMRLFRYISGGNEEGRKIAMTAPVLVSQSGDRPGMSFILPREITAAPDPTDRAVRSDEIPAGRFAVYRYSGGRNESNERQARDQLLGWIEARGLEVSDQPFYGYYDPPWIPPFLRRNEVLWRLDGTEQP